MYIDSSGCDADSRFRIKFGENRFERSVDSRTFWRGHRRIGVEALGSVELGSLTSVQILSIQSASPPAALTIRVWEAAHYGHSLE